MRGSKIISPGRLLRSRKISIKKMCIKIGIPIRLIDLLLYSDCHNRIINQNKPIDAKSAIYFDSKNIDVVLEILNAYEINHCVKNENAEIQFLYASKVND